MNSLRREQEALSNFEALERAVHVKAPYALEDSVSAIDTKNVDPCVVPMLCDLLSTAWHYRHEDIVRKLQSIRDPRACQALAQAALLKFAYLDHDNSYAFARKCTWALADIGTEEAKALLSSLANTDDETIAGYARKRLHSWQAELNRKAAITATK